MVLLSYANFKHFLFFVSHVAILCIFFFVSGFPLFYSKKFSFSMHSKTAEFTHLCVYQFVPVSVLFACVCTCVRICLPVWRHRGHKSISGGVFYYSPSCFLRQGLSLTVKLAIPARLASQPSRSLPLSPP